VGPKLRGYCERRATAVHEAGHAVAHLACGWPFKRATITPTDRYRGAVEADPAAPRPRPYLGAVACLAGTIAVDRWLGSRWVSRWSLFNDDWAAAAMEVSLEIVPVKPLSADEDRELQGLLERVPRIVLARLSSLQIARELPEASKEIDRRLNQAARTAERLLDRLWPKVIRIADLLLARGTIGWAESQEAFMIGPRGSVFRGLGRLPGGGSVFQHTRSR
jgi:hypothetical protein